MSRPKSAELRQGNANLATLQTTADIDIPDAPKDFTPFGRRLWIDIWTAGKNAYQPLTDCHVVARYVSLPQRRRALRELLETEGWLSEGSTGQLVIHPAAKLLDSVEGKLALEDRSLSPEARLRLGISSVEHNEARSLPYEWRL